MDRKRFIIKIYLILFINENITLFYHKICYFNNQLLEKFANKKNNYLRANLEILYRF
jgi:hypothetical protein